MNRTWFPVLLCLLLTNTVQSRAVPKQEEETRHLYLRTKLSDVINKLKERNIYDEGMK